MKKKTRRKKPPTVTLPPTRKYEFPQVKGKVIEAVKLYLEDDDTSLSLIFADKTHLWFDLEPGLTVRSEFSDWKTGNWRPIKSWPPRHRRSSWADE